MEYSEAVQEANDILWFGIDIDGFVCSVFSGGGMLPTSVVRSIEDNSKLARFFNSLEKVSSKIYTSETTANEIKKYKKMKHPLDLSQSYELAEKGITVFDKVDLVRRLDSNYYLSMRPVVLLNRNELPSDIKTIISLTEINISIQKGDSRLILENCYT